MQFTDFKKSNAMCILLFVHNPSFLMPDHKLQVFTIKRAVLFIYFIYYKIYNIIKGVYLNL